MSLRKDMPMLARNEGVWEGYYRLYDARGNKTDEHKARLICRIHDDEIYHQTNLYRWADGKTQTRDFPANIRDGRIWFDTDIEGWAAPVALDAFDRTMMLNWTRKGEPDLYLYEMIQLSDDGQSRARVWHWFKNDRLWQRTLIDEAKISDDWRAYEDLNPSYEDIRD
jgi:hypothetical protein